MSLGSLDVRLDAILAQYGKSFASKQFTSGSTRDDELMLIFGLTQAIKDENSQYWGRELGMCWQLLITELCKQKCGNFKGPIRRGKDEICDLVLGKEAIDTKYRVGSGDSGTLKKFKQYGETLMKMGFTPILLFLRLDNLPAAITACVNGGWTVKTGDDSYDYLRKMTGFDLKSWLQARKNQYSLSFPNP